MNLCIKRKLSGLLGMLMAFTLIMGEVSVTTVMADDVNTERDGTLGISVSFADGFVNGNEITYAVGEEQITVTVDGAEVADSKVSVPMDNMSGVTFTLSANYDPNTMEVKVYGDSGFNTTLFVSADKKTSLADRTDEGGYPNEEVKLKVVQKEGTGGGGGEPTPGNGSSRPAELYTGEQKQSNWTLTGEGDIYINGVTLPTSESKSGNVTYNLNADDTKVYFEFTCFHNMRYTSIKINGTDYSSYIPSTQQELLDALDANGNDQTMNFVLPGIDYAENYAIEADWKVIDESDAAYEPIGNFLWSYLEADAGTDDYVDHGKLTFVSLKYDGKTYNGLEELAAADKCYLHFEELNNGQIGSAVFPYGAELTVKLIPEYGYQLTSFEINGGKFETGSEIGVYTFTIPRGNFHLGAHFTQVSDTVKSGSQEITSGSIKLGANEIDMGSAVLTVADATTTEAEQTAFSGTATGYTVDSYLDLNLNQVVYKGNTTDYWTNDMSTLNSSATVSLSLDNTLASSDIEIIHQKHDGTYEVIPATYDASSNTVTFNTSSFSKYAIAYKEPKANLPAEGKILTDNVTNATYKVTKSDATDQTVEYVANKNTKAKTVVIPADITIDGITYKVTSIADNVFENNKSITKVTIGKNVTSIGVNAFSSCKQLKTVGIGTNVEKIGSKAFYKCTSLTKITIPSKVSEIGKQTFYGCKKLKTITIKTAKLTSKKVGSKAFKGISANATVKVPKAKKKAYKSLFSKKGIGANVKIK